MSDPAYKPPPTLSTSAKVAKRGAYMRDTMVPDEDDSVLKYLSQLLTLEDLALWLSMNSISICT